MLTPSAAEASARLVLETHQAERLKLDVVRRYYKGRQRLPAVIPASSPREVRVMAASSRVNVMPIVVNSLVQASRVDGIRNAEGDPLKVWEAWQANRWDARQTGLYRSAAQYGVAYIVVLPGDRYPVIRSASPRSMATLYGNDPDWPALALERLPAAGGKYFRLYDPTHRYDLRFDGDRFEHTDTQQHGAGVTPVVRALDEIDDDDEDEPPSFAIAMPGQQETTTRGQVAPLMGLQDQIDLTTFALQIATHYGAFKQRWIIGWAADTEAEAIKSGATTLFTLDEDPDKVKLGEFTQTDLGGFIASREASLKHAAALSQTPVHELTADIIQMSAEALAAAEAGKERKAQERHDVWGEAIEQAMSLAGQFMAAPVPVDAQVKWRDTSARAFAATVDALGKLSQMLGVPQQELWERIPGVTQQDVERFKKAAGQGDPFADLATMLDEQASGAAVTADSAAAAEIKQKADAMGALIRAGATFESAAAQVGLSGLQTSGAVPVSLRVPERDAQQLEQQ